jgi:cyclomaltodextrinase
LRRRHLWLVRARTRAEYLTPSAMALRACGSDPGQRLLLLLNVADDPVRFDVDATGLTFAQTPRPGTVPADPLMVPPHSWTILA